MFFVKYGKGRYLQDIIDGYIRFAPISMYREWEQDAYSNGVADPFDGMARSKVDILRFISSNEEKCLVGNIEINIDLEGMEKLGVFCLSQYESVIHMRNNCNKMLEMFPETTHVLVIHSPNTFAKDIQTALPRVAGGTVRYGDEMRPPQHADDMWKQALYKRTRYAYQNEFRFIFTREEFNVPFSYRYENHSKMSLLNVDEIDLFIADSIGNDIGLRNR